MDLINAFSLPFSIRVTAQPPAAPLRISIATAMDDSNDAFLGLTGTVKLWSLCAMLGAAPGAGLPPRFRPGPLDVDQVVTATRHGVLGIEFEVADLPVDVAYANVLLHSLYCLATEVELSSVVLSLPVPGVVHPEVVSLVKGPRSAFPGVGPVGFPCSSEDTGADGRVVTLGLGRAPSPAEWDALAGLLTVWQALGAHGGFLSPPVLPGNTRVFGGEPVLLRDEVEWELSDVTIDEAGYGLLINMLQAYSSQNVPIVDFDVG